MISIRAAKRANRIILLKKSPLFIIINHFLSKRYSLESAGFAAYILLPSNDATSSGIAGVNLLIDETNSTNSP
jgi:hypothetical protein